MKRIVVLCLFLIICLFFVACESRELSSETVEGTEVALQTVNKGEALKIKNVTLEVPIYWKEDGSKKDVLKYYAEKGNTEFFEYKAACMDIEFPLETDLEYEVSFDGLYADNQNMIAAIEKRFTDANVLSDEVFESNHGTKGILYEFSLNQRVGLLEEKPARGFCFCFPSASDRRWFYIYMIIVDEADEHNYREDFLTMLKTVKCEPQGASEETSANKEGDFEGNGNEESKGITIDYSDEKTFENALNAGVKVNGKIVQFKVNDYKPDSILGVNCWSGEHLNFISEDELDVKKGDTVVGRITEEPTIILGSWKILYEPLMIGGTLLEKDADELPANENEAKAPVKAIDFKGDNYNDVIKKFKDAGFINIKTKVLYDIFWGFTPEGSVESVSIAGKTDFRAGDIFSRDSEIIITYHMKESADPSLIKMEKNAAAYEGLNYVDVQKTFLELGFVHIVLEAKETTDVSYKDGEVFDVTVNGFHFNAGESFKSGTKVLIKYYTRTTTLDEIQAIIDDCYGKTAEYALGFFKKTDCTILYTVDGVPANSIAPNGLFFSDGTINRETKTVVLDFTKKNPENNYQELEMFLPREMALRVAIVAMTNSSATDVFKKDGCTYDTSKFHKYSDISGFYLSVHKEGKWIAKNEKTWRVTGLVCRLSGYTTYLHASMDITYENKKYVVSHVEKMITSGETITTEDMKNYIPERLEPTEDNPFLTVSQSLVKKNRDALAEEKQNNKTMPTEMRIKWINDQFSVWTGEHKQLKELIKKKLHDEKSYNHIETTYHDITYQELADSINKTLKEAGYSKRVKVGDLFIICNFTAKNVFNATVKNVAYGIAHFDSNTIELIGVE